MGLSPSAGVFPALPPCQPIQPLGGELPHAGSVCSVFIKTTNRGSASRCPRTFLRGRQKPEPAVGALEKSIIPNPAAPCPTEPSRWVGAPHGKGGCHSTSGPIEAVVSQQEAKGWWDDGSCGDARLLHLTPAEQMCFSSYSKCSFCPVPSQGGYFCCPFRPLLGLDTTPHSFLG